MTTDFDKIYNTLVAKLEAGRKVDTPPKKDLIIYKDENGDQIEFKVYKNDDYLGNFLKDQMEGNFGDSWSNHVVDGISLGDVNPLDPDIQKVEVVKESDEVDNDDTLTEEGELKSFKVIVTTNAQGESTASSPINDPQNKVNVEVKTFGEDYDAAHDFYNQNKGS